MLILLEHLIEPRSLALGERQHLLAIGLRIEQLLRGLAARPRHDIVLVALGVLLIALAVLVRFDRIALRVLHRLGHHDLLQRHADDAYPHVVGIERALQSRPRVIGDGGIERERPVERGLSDRLAQRALADLPQRVLDVLDLEEVLARVRLGVLDRGAHLHEIGIGGEHARIVRDAVLLGDVHDDLALDGPGQMPVVAGTHRALVLAEAQHHGPLLRIDAVHAARDPHHADQHQHGGQPAAEARRARGAGAAAAAAEQRGQAPLQVAQHVVQVVLRLLGTVPGIALLAAGFVPGHGYTQLRT